MIWNIVMVYLGIALVTGISILLECSLTGSKQDYHQMRLQIWLSFLGQRKRQIVCYVAIVIIGMVLWPALYFCRIKDLLSRR